LAKSQWSFKTAVELSAALAAKKVSAVELAEDAIGRIERHDAKINAMLGSGTWTGGVTCATSPCAPDQVVSATVTLQFQTVVPQIMPAMWGTMNITQTATMRYE